MAKKRMICFISAQPLPNFIAVNEPATRPDVLHCLYTPHDPLMQQRWEALRKTLAKAFPQIEVRGVQLKDAYDARAIQRDCFRLLKRYQDDEWVLNATGGTKLMSAPTIEVFNEVPETFKNMRVATYYVETTQNCLLKVARDWTVKRLPFTQCIELETYFSLYGQPVLTEPPRTPQEKKLLQQLRKLDWQVWSSVRLLATPQPRDLRPRDLAEYDAIAIRGYQLYAFECNSVAESLNLQD